MSDTATASTPNTTTTDSSASLLADGGDKTQNTTQTTQQVNTQQSKGFVGEDGAFVEGWTNQLPDSLGEAKGKFSKFKNLSDMAISYHALEQKLGKSANAVFYPGAEATPEEISAFRKSVGIPETAEGYKLKPENLPEGLGWSDDVAAESAKIAHKYNIPPAAMAEFVNLQIQQAVQRDKMIGEMAQQDHNEQKEKGYDFLRKEFGADKFDSTMALAKRAAATGGLDLKAKGLEDPLTVAAFARLGKLLGEDALIKNGDSPEFMTPSARAKDIQTNPKNPLYQRYHDADSDVVNTVRALLKQG